MPVTRITSNFKLTKSSEFIAVVHQVLQDVLKIKSCDRLMILDEKTDHFYQPLNTDGPYVLIEIELFNGRSLNVKRKLYKTLVEKISQFNVPENNIRIALIEIPKENWGIRGGQAACDVNLEYKIDI